MAALPQCDAFGFIYDQAGDPAVDTLVTLKRVIDASGNSILLSPLTTLTDSAGSFHFTLPEDATAYISARATALWNCPNGRAFKVPPGPTGELITTFLMPESSSVVPPLVYVSDTLSLPRSSPTADGYLAAADYVRFDAATIAPVVVESFNLRTGAVLPVGTDYQAFYLALTGGTLSGALTLAADPATAMQAATRQYVDGKFAEGVSGVATFNGRTGAVLPIGPDYASFYLSLTGGALTGPLTLAADPTAPMHAATRQYVLAQLASSTAGVASFNGRTGTVLPLGPDYASFYAPLVHTHTKSAITDLGVFSTSQSGLVPQPTSGDAAKFLTGAGTWSAAASGGMSLPATWLASDFKASGSAQRYTGGITSGQVTLTTGSVTDFVVGQGVYVVGAGASGAALVSKVVAVSGITITLQDAAATTVTGAMIQHDDTVAINTAIAAVFNAGGGDLIFAPGTYRCNGPFTDINSILKVPLSPVTGGPIIGITLRGMAPSFPAFVGPQTTGVIIQTDKVGADINSSLFATATWQAGTDYTTPNNIFLTIEAICFRTYDNPNINALDLGMCGMTWLKNVTVDTGMTLLSGAQPTHGTMGLRLPRTNTAGCTMTENVFVCNYAIGIDIGEIWTATGTNGVERCLTGFRFGFGFHCLGGVCRLAGYQCRTVIEFTGKLAVDIHLEYENDAGGNWWSEVSGRDIYDPLDLATGMIRYTKVRSGAGDSLLALTTGLSKVTMFNLHGLGNRIANLNTFSEDLTLAHNLTVVGTETLTGKLISAGAADSAGTGFQQLRVPNSGGGGGGALTTGLISYWKMDETAVDGSSGYRNTPYADSMSNNALTPHTAVYPVAGKINNAPSAVGSGYLDVADNITQNFSGSVTIAGWIFLHDPPNRLSSLLAKWGGAGSEEFLLIYNGFVPCIQFACSNNGTSNTVAAFNVSLAANTWYFIAGWYDHAAHTVNIRLNNNTPVSAAFTGPLYHSVGTMVSLLYADGTSNIFTDGAVDEIGIWSRVLTTAEIDSLYNTGSGLSYPF